MWQQGRQRVARSDALWQRRQRVGHSREAPPPYRRPGRGALCRPSSWRPRALHSAPLHVFCTARPRCLVMLCHQSGILTRDQYLIPCTRGSSRLFPRYSHHATIIHNGTFCRDVSSICILPHEDILHLLRVILSRESCIELASSFHPWVYSRLRLDALTMSCVCTLFLRLVRRIRLVFFWRCMHLYLCYGFGSELTLNVICCTWSNLICGGRFCYTPDFMLRSTQFQSQAYTCVNREIQQVGPRI